MKIKLLIVAFLLKSYIAIGTELSSKKMKSELEQMEDSMRNYVALIHKGIADEDRYDANEKFISLLEKALENPKSFKYPFDSLSNIVKLTSPDKKIRIYNWLLPKTDGSFEYFGIIQKKSGPNKFTIYALMDKSEDIKNPELKTLHYNQWYGAVYYSIVQPKKGKKQYILLGWDGNDRLSNKKLIDVLHFNDKEEPEFGMAIFNIDKKTQQRVFFEFNEQAVMSLKYYKNGKKIVFDHLEPSHPRLIGQYQFYGPDFTYDSFVYKKGVWKLIKDIQPLNAKSTKDKNYNPPK